MGSSIISTKIKVLIASAICCFLGTMVQASASDAETSKFLFDNTGSSVLIMQQEAIEKDERAANLIFAVYDSETLIASEIISIDEGETSFDMGWCRIKLPYDADRVSVKAFLWTADGNCTPISNASELAEDSAEPDSSGEQGIVIGIRPSTASKLPMITIVTDTGFVGEYPVNEQTEADKFYQILTGTYGKENAPSYNGEIITKDDIDISRIDDLEVVYSITDEALTMDEKRNAVGGVLTYDAETMSFGKYKIDETSLLIDINICLERGNDQAGILTPDKLTDGSEYTVYLCDPEPDTEVYRYAVITSSVGVYALTPLAIVRSEPEISGINGSQYLSIPVLVNGMEDTVYYTDTEATFTKGDIIVYSTNDKGVIRELYKVLDMSTMIDYDSLFSSALSAAKSGGSFSSILNSNVLADPSTNEYRWSDSRYPTEVYFGPIYEKINNSLELITGAQIIETSDGECLATPIIMYNNDYIKDFWLFEKNSYVCNYWSDFDDKDFVYVSDPFYNAVSIYSNILTTLNTEEYIAWDGDTSLITAVTEDVRPPLAFIRTIDGYVADVVYYMGY